MVDDDFTFSFSFLVSRFWLNAKLETRNKEPEA